MNTLRARLIALTAILQLVAALVVTVVVIFAVRGELLNRIEGEVQEIAAGHSVMISNWIGDRYAIMASTLPAVGQDDPMPTLQQIKAGGRFDLVYFGYADKRTLFTDHQDLPAVVRIAGELQHQPGQGRHPAEVLDEPVHQGRREFGAQVPGGWFEPRIDRVGGGEAHAQIGMTGASIGKRAIAHGVERRKEREDDDEGDGPFDWQEVEP